MGCRGQRAALAGPCPRLIKPGAAGSFLLVKTAGGGTKAAEMIRTIPGILEAGCASGEKRQENGLRIRLAKDADNAAVRDAIFRKLAAADLPIREMREEREPLEELFLRLTE